MRSGQDHKARVGRIRAGSVIVVPSSFVRRCCAVNTNPIGHGEHRAPFAMSMSMSEAAIFPEHDIAESARSARQISALSCICAGRTIGYGRDNEIFGVVRIGLGSGHHQLRLSGSLCLPLRVVTAVADEGNCRGSAIVLIEVHSARLRGGGSGSGSVGSDRVIGRPSVFWHSLESLSPDIDVLHPDDGGLRVSDFVMGNQHRRRRVYLPYSPAVAKAFPADRAKPATNATKPVKNLSIFITSLLSS